MDDIRRLDEAAHAPRRHAGPVLFLRGYGGGHLTLAALVVQAEKSPAPPLHANRQSIPPVTVLRRDGLVVLIYEFSLPAASGSGYTLEGTWYPVETVLDDDLRIAYVSCNGQEQGDLNRTSAERNLLWQRLARQHAKQPLHLLLHGGDQIYADEMLETHPALQAWAHGDDTAAYDAETLEEIREGLRHHLLERYLAVCTQTDTAWLMARVPSLCMWDDHDICDGWGSLPTEKLDAPVGRTVFEVAREFFLLFQCGTPPDQTPRICADRTGTSLTWSLQLPGVGLVAPDLRSERRPTRVLGATGRKAFDDSLTALSGSRIFVLSSVPALGPRLSWVEMAMRLTPRMEKYEDDLRDQWQSRSHRSEWRAFLRQLIDRHEQSSTALTLLSGEIHLATRGEMATDTMPLQQLVASGIAHPPPPQAYARGLSMLARLGESPLARHPIRLYPLPGQGTVYTAQRNYLMLERTAGAWHAWWELERDGATPTLSLESGYSIESKG